MGTQAGLSPISWQSSASLESAMRNVMINPRSKLSTTNLTSIRKIFMRTRRVGNGRPLGFRLILEALSCGRSSQAIADFVAEQFESAGHHEEHQDEHREQSGHEESDEHHEEHHEEHQEKLQDRSGERQGVRHDGYSMRAERCRSGRHQEGHRDEHQEHADHDESGEHHGEHYDAEAPTGSQPDEVSAPGTG